MIVKIVLGESLNCLIRELKLSYRRIFRIIGESLAAVRGMLRRGGLGGVLSINLRWNRRFSRFFRFCIDTFLRDFERPTLGVIILLLMQGWRFASTLPCQETNPDGVICEWKKNNNHYGLRRLNRKRLDAYKKKTRMRQFDTSSFRGLWLGWEQAFLTRNRFRATDCSRPLRSLLKSFTKPCSSLAVILPAQVPYSAPPHPHCFKPIRTAGAKRGCNTQTLYGLILYYLKILLASV